VTFSAPFPPTPHQAYRAWLEPELLRRWMAAGGLEVTRAEVDERPGGYFRIWQADAGAEIGGFECELVELVPDQRLVFPLGLRRPGPGRRAVLRLAAHRHAARGAGRGTVLTLVHERLDALAAAMPRVAENVGPGWDSALGKLAAMASL
jgi:uncharacterized protein YndB with AHSA1/START domain